MATLLARKLEIYQGPCGRTPLVKIKLWRLFSRSLAFRGNVSAGANLHVGLGSTLWAPRHLQIGRDVYIGKGTTIEVDGEIGDETLIANNVGIVGRRDHATEDIGTPIRSARWVGDFPEQLSEPTTVGSDVWIGFGAIVLSGVTIGDSSVVAAGAVVTKDVAPNTIVAGVPAVPMGKRFTNNDFERHWTLLSSRGVRRLTEDDQS
ncbi:acyltransferase [Arthrobacter sp. SO3]|uniref:acyltransferase n=1 Tax=Arthrobacter sp. SO3 TaxID=1897057 RepID=UPI00299DB0B4|nr:DapH/DapD/GlmU-related protein [Arthrobacter sp. SO3]